MLEAIKQHVMWRAIPFAGLVAGTVFLLMNMILSPLLLQIDPTIILRYFASLVMGTSALVTNNSSFLIIGILTHYSLSMIFALVIAIVVHRWGLGVGIVGGAILGLSFYGINLYAGTRIFEWFFAINSSLLLVSHIVFGAVAGGVYEMLDTYDEPLMGGDDHATA
jgi:hypothetical protein